jgi:Ca2+-binding EF-hand superfamily protein
MDFSSPNDGDHDNRLSLAELEDLRDAFRLLDTCNTGKVAVKELLEVLGEMKQDGNRLSTSTRKNLQRLYNAIASLPPGEHLTEDYFIHLVTASDANDPRSDLQKVFDLFSGGKNYIALSDLSKVADELGEDMTKGELEEMIERAAPNGGKVTLKEFSEIMNKKLFA